MGNLRGRRVVKVDTCNNLLSSVHTIFVVILLYVRLNINSKNIISYYY